MEELPEESLERLSRVTKLLSTQRTLPAKLEAVVALVKRMIPSCDAAGISLLVDGEPTSSAVTDRLAVEIDLVQYQTGEGPCLAALTDRGVVRIDVLERDSRFRRFAPGALDLDLHSVLSVPLAANGRTVGALNLYSHRPDAFDAESEAAVQPMADYASELISRSQPSLGVGREEAGQRGHSCVSNDGHRRQREETGFRLREPTREGRQPRTPLRAISPEQLPANCAVWRVHGAGSSCIMARRHNPSRVA